MSALFLLLSLPCLDFVRAASSTGVGGYVAQGVGMGSDAQSIPGTQPVSEGVLIVSGMVLTATKLENGDILVANQTIHPSGSTTASAAGFTGTGSPSNDTFGVDQCYSSWDDYWSASYASEMSSFSQKDMTAIPTTTWTYTGTNTYSGYKAGTSTLVTTIDTTIDVINGGFTISTNTIDTTSSTVITQSNYPGTTETYTNTVTWYSTETIGGDKVPPKPTCKLPSVVQDCENKWETYLTSALVPSPTPPPHCDIGAGFLQNTNTVPPCAASFSMAEASYYSKYEGTDGITPPLCTAASIGGSLCQSVRDAYQLYNQFAPTIDEKTMSQYGEPLFFNQGTQGLFKGNGTHWIWPTSSTMSNAPSCTLGCGRCAVTGGTVQLIYWPATPTPTASNNATLKARQTPAPVVTVETLGTTFTSPTLYISYRSLYASNACGSIGTEVGSTILAIPPDKPLSSVFAISGACDAHFRATQVYTATAPFTVEDLHEPVPYSIYSSQPWCQTLVHNQGCTGTCPTTAPYKPILVVNNDLLRGLQEDWTDCWGDIRGVYDPPLALTEAKTEAAPTYSAPGQPTPATGLAPNTPAPTGTAAPDNLPTNSNGEAVPSVPKQPDSPSATGKGSDPAPTLNQQTQNPKPDPSPTDPQPTIVKVDPHEISLSPVEDHSSVVQIFNGDHTTILTAGDPPVTVGNQVMSVASSGNAVVVGTGKGASTIDAVTAPTAATFDAQALTMSEISSDHSSAVQVVNDGKTATLTPGGSAVTVGSQIISAASSGRLVIGTGSTASTVNVVRSTSKSSTQSSLSSSSISTSRSSTTTSNRPSSTTSTASSSSSAASSRNLASSGTLLAALLFGVFTL